MLFLSTILSEMARVSTIDVEHPDVGETYTRMFEAEHGDVGMADIPMFSDICRLFM